MSNFAFHELSSKKTLSGVISHYQAMLSQLNAGVNTFCSFLMKISGAATSETGVHTSGSFLISVVPFTAARHTAVVSSVHFFPG
jgi:hypothetical protein